MAEYVATSDTTGTLRGICPDCDRMIYRTANPQKIAAVRGDLDVTVTQAGARIEETTASLADQGVSILNPRAAEISSMRLHLFGLASLVVARQSFFLHVHDAPQ
jgi:hypothetical protein